MESEASTSSWRSIVAALFVLLVAEVIIFWPPADVGASPVPSAAGSHRYHAPWEGRVTPDDHSRYLLGDPLQQMQPWRHHMRDIVGSGQIPYWNHLNGLGQPFLANPQTRVLYPLHWLYFIGDEMDMQLLYLALHIFLFGAGFIAFLSRFEVGFLGLTIGGVASSCFGMQVLWMLSPHASAFAWLPWLLVASEFAMERSSKRAILLSFVTTAMMFLAGHPETAFKSVITVWMIFVCRLLTDRPGIKRSARAVVTVGAAQILGLIMAAPLILPFLDYVADSESLHMRRLEPAYPALNGFAAFAKELAAWLSQVASIEAHGSDLEKGQWWLTTVNLREVGLIYGGVLVAVLAPLGLVRQHPLRLAFSVVGLFAATITFRIPYLYDAVLYLPGFDVGANQRFASIFHVVLVLAAALGVEQLVCLPNLAKSKSTWIPVLFMILLVGGAWGWEVWQKEPENTAQSDLLMRAALYALGLSIAALFGLFLLRWERLMALAALLFVAVLLLDVFLFMRPRVPWADKDATWPTTPVIEFMKKNCTPENGRILCVGGSFPGDMNLAHDLAFLDSYSAMQPRQEALFLEAANTPVTPSGKKRIAWSQIENFSREHLNLASVRYLFIPGDMTQHAGRKPEETITDGVGDQFSQIYAAADGLILERLKAKPRAWLKSASGTVTIKDYEAHRFTLDVSVEDELDVLETSDRLSEWWGVRVDGQEAEVVTVNEIFRGVEIEKGEHTVEFYARPTRSFVWGVRAALGAALVCLLWLVLLTRRRSTS